MTTQMLVSSDDLDTSPLRWLADGLVPETGCGYVWGPPGAGKSLAFGLELGLAVATGTKFFGRDTRQGTVVYALGEGLPGQGIRKQARLARQARDDTIAIAEVARDHGDAAARALAAALPRYDGSNLKIICEPFDIRLTPKGEISASMREAIALIGELDEPPSLIICDAAADFTGGHSLSSDSNATAFAAGLKALAAETDACCIVIAHPTAANTKMLGAGRLIAAADFVFEVQPDAAAAPGAAQTATCTCRKQKDGSRPEPFGWVLEPAAWSEPVIGDDGEPTGETEHVESATVRLLQPPGRSPEPRSRPAAPLPVLAPARQDERPRKRSGIRPQRHGLHAVPDLAPRRDLPARLISVQCPDCSRLGVTCDTRMGGSSALIPVSFDPVLAVHADRAVAAWMAGAVSEAELDTVLAAVA